MHQHLMILNKQVRQTHGEKEKKTWLSIAATRSVGNAVEHHTNLEFYTLTYDFNPLIPRIRPLQFISMHIRAHQRALSA